MSEFGHSVALNLNGNRIFIGSPQFGDDLNATSMLVQAYHFDGIDWVQIGNNTVGETPNSRFGHAVSTDDTGNIVLVGAPLDNEVREHAGQIQIFVLLDSEWKEFKMGKVCMDIRLEPNSEGNLQCIVLVDT
jgi:hypothetical protein